MAGDTTFLLFPAAAALLTVITFVPTAEAVPAVFVFGDSTVDVGNNNFLPGDSAKANHSFYGVDYPGGVPTGRFSNGYNGVDFLAKMIGFPKSPPPVLSIKNKQEVFRGVSFGSGGSGILDATKIYNLGARKFAVIGTAPIGCVPALRITNANGDCVENLNDLSRRHNSATAALLQDLSLKLEGMRYSHANSYELLSDIISSPVQNGYKEVDSACCGGERLNAVDECTANATLCSDRRGFVFWDSVHPTQVTYRLVAEHAYEGSPLFASPINKWF